MTGFEMGQAFRKKERRQWGLGSGRKAGSPNAMRGASSSTWVTIPSMLNIRKADLDDIPLILEFIHELAEYERAPEEAVATREDLRRDGFSDQPRFYVEIAEWEGEPAGFALWFFNYSTWQGKPGLYLEDLFVRPRFRKQGIGKALLVHLARVAVEKGCGRYQWQVLDWNTPALRFYESLGAKVMKEWLTMRVSGDALGKLAEQGSS